MDTYRKCKKCCRISKISNEVGRINNFRAFECNKITQLRIGYIIRFGQSEIVLHFNLQILKKKTKNIIDNSL